MAHFVELLKLDTGHGGLRAVPKLSTMHTEPNNLQRMNVRLAVQVQADPLLLPIYLSVAKADCEYYLSQHSLSHLCYTLQTLFVHFFSCMSRVDFIFNLNSNLNQQ